MTAFLLTHGGGELPGAAVELAAAPAAATSPAGRAEEARDGKVGVGGSTEPQGDVLDRGRLILVPLGRPRTVFVKSFFLGMRSHLCFTQTIHPDTGQDR